MWYNVSRQDGIVFINSNSNGNDVILLWDCLQFLLRFTNGSLSKVILFGGKQTGF